MSARRDLVKENKESCLVLEKNAAHLVSRSRRRVCAIMSGADGQRHVPTFACTAGRERRKTPNGAIHRPVPVGCLENVG